MRLKPRHYILFAVIVGVFAFNLWRKHSAHPIAKTPGTVRFFGTPAGTPAWRAFDKTYTLRNAPDPDFQPALHDLQQQITLAASDPTTSDLSGCLTWLEFYRQGALHPAKDPQWQQRSTRHLDSCSKYHADTTF